MPRKNVKQKDTPELFAKVFKVINGLKDKRSYITVNRIAKEIHAKLEQMGLKPNSRNVLIQVRRALKFGVQKNLFSYKAGKYRLAMTAVSSKSSKKEVVPLDSLELLKSRRSKRKSKHSDIKKHRCTRQEHTSSCRNRFKKRASKPNKRYLSRKCKSRYYMESSNEKSNKTFSNSTGNNSQTLGASTEEITNPENNKSESSEIKKVTVVPVASDISHWDNKQEAINKSKYGKQSKKSRIRLSSCEESIPNSEETKSRKNKKRKIKTLKEIENLSQDNTISSLSTSTAIAAAIMIMMSLWYGYR